MRIAGGIYLAVLGGRIVLASLHREARTPGGADVPETPSIRRAFVQGLLTNLTSPKAILFFAAALSQFVDVDAGTPGWVQIGMLGLVDVLAGAVPWTVVVLVGAALSGVLARRRVRLWWDRVTGTVLGGLGVGVLAKG